MTETSRRWLAVAVLVGASWWAGPALAQTPAPAPTPSPAPAAAAEEKKEEKPKTLWDTPSASLYYLFF